MALVRIDVCTVQYRLGIQSSNIYSNLPLTPLFQFLSSLQDGFLENSSTGPAWYSHLMLLIYL